MAVLTFWRPSTTGDGVLRKDAQQRINEHGKMHGLQKPTSAATNFRAMYITIANTEKQRNKDKS